MKIVRQKAFARAGLLGNPSDGYHGKTIAFVIRDLFAEVTISESDFLEFETKSCDSLRFDSLADFSAKIEADGFYGGVRLMKSALKQFVKYCSAANVLKCKPFKISFQSNIPREVGLAGSSAIVIAAMRSFCEWCDVAIEPHVLASLALSAERGLGINAGLQDRVVQSYEGTVYMDFAVANMQQAKGIEFGRYESLAPPKASNFYIAYANSAAESTNVLHGELRQKYDSGDRKVIDGLKQIAALPDSGRECLEANDIEGLAKLMDRNFDLRKSICRLNPFHVKMVDAARSVGASAKYCGSGGAIVGTFSNVQTWEQLKIVLSAIGCEVFKPTIE